MRIWDRLASSGLELSVQAYTTAISACASLKAPDRADELFKAMRADRLKPDCHAYTALISAHGSLGQWQRAAQVRLHCRLAVTCETLLMSAVLVVHHKYPPSLYHVVRLHTHKHTHAGGNFLGSSCYSVRCVFGNKQQCQYLSHVMAVSRNQ